MVLFGWPERRRRQDFRDGAADLGFGFFSDAFLFVVVIINAASVLGSEVVPLSIQRGGIDPIEEQVHQFWIRHLSCVVRQLHSFGVSCPSAAHLSIRRSFDVSLGVSHARLQHAWFPLVRQLESPEAPGECPRSFDVSTCSLVQRPHHWRFDGIRILSLRSARRTHPPAKVAIFTFFPSTWLGGHVVRMAPLCAVPIVVCARARVANWWDVQVNTWTSRRNRTRTMGQTVPDREPPLVPPRTDRAPPRSRYRYLFRSVREISIGGSKPVVGSRGPRDVVLGTSWRFTILASENCTLDRDRRGWMRGGSTSRLASPTHPEIATLTSRTTEMTTDGTTEIWKDDGERDGLPVPAG